MCGIAAIISKKQRSVNDFIEKSLTLLYHRGPDQQNSCCYEGVALIHTRLSILDLTEAGTQPMKSSCGRYTIIFNGEIYNHLELRKKWLKNHAFEGHSDTETIIELFRLLREQIFSEMVGMWAIAIYDNDENKLIISRDRYGQKPLYYLKRAEEILLSSEIKPLLNLDQSNQANTTMLGEYLAMGNYHHLGEQTFFEGITQLLPATYCWIDVRRGTIGATIKYWKLPLISGVGKIPFTDKDAASLKEVIVEAVRSQMLSDVPIAATLSGGIDSSIITGILASFSRPDSPVKVFTAQTPSSSYDETKYVNAVKEKWGDRIDIRYKNLNELKLSESLATFLKYQEEPFGDPSIMAHGHLMTMASDEKIKVVLGGQGADEVARGYRHNIHQLFSHELSQFNFSFVLPELQHAGYTFSEISRIALGGLLPKVERSLRLKSRKRRMKFLGNRMSSTNGTSAPSFLALANDLDGGLKESIYGLHLPHLVHYDDRNSMAKSIEGRMPFLDHRILEAISEYRPSDLYQKGLSKYLIRASCKEFLPDIIYKRKDKIGFYTPLNKMLKEDSTWIDEVIMNSSFSSNEVILKDILIYKSGGFTIDSSRRLFRVLSVCLWSELFNVKF